MYKRLYTFHKKNSVIYNLQFGFRQQYSTSHALINITVHHQILLTKLNHYEICGVSNDWFKSYLSNCNQYVSINGHESGCAVLNCGVSSSICSRFPSIFTIYK